MTQEKFTFQAEVSRLLHIVAHALYSDRDVFVRELVANAADASDKMRYLALSNADLAKEDLKYSIIFEADEKAKTLTISDVGLGMSRDDLIQNLGTIAESGTAAFLKELEAKKAKDDANLIGQFGVGFYSSFMVADEVRVLSRKVGESDAHLWVSDGKGGYSIEKAEKETRGTVITLHLKDDALEYLQENKLTQIVKKFSDHIDLPIFFKNEKEEMQMNKGTALWLKSKSDITEDQHKEFYHHIAHAFDDPFHAMHIKAEGTLEYKSLLYIPTERPYDLFHPERKHNIRLYVKRMFITDKCEGLLPHYLRFVAGVVDSEDLPLNISREMLQNNPYVAKIKTHLTKKVFDELKGIQKKDEQGYQNFFEKFGPVLKEGLYEDMAQKDALLPLCLFYSAAQKKFISLESYVQNMKEGQEAIYYITGDSVAALEASPHLEGFRKKDVDVLLLTDPIDDFWLPMIGDFKEKAFKSVTKAGTDLDKLEGSAKDDKKDETDKKVLDPFLASLKVALTDKVKDVRVSKRLNESPVCLVADDSDVDLRMERLLKQHGQGPQNVKRILEVNPDHNLIQKMADDGFRKDKGLVDAASYVLYEQARILEGEGVSDAKAFCTHMNTLLTRIAL